MKFDIIVGNPPFQDPTAKSSKKLWPSVIQKSFILCKEDGYLNFISPASIASPSNKLFNYLKEYNTININFNVKRYFKNIGSTFCYFNLQKTKTLKNIVRITTNSEQFNINISTMDFLPTTCNKLAISILSKILNGTSLGIQSNSFLHSSRADKVNRLKTDEFMYPVQHTNKTMLWSNVKHPNCKIKKVIFPISGKTKPIIDLYYEYGTSEHFAWVEVTNKIEADNVITFLLSNIILFLRETTKYYQSWSKYILARIPKIDISRTWTDDELYEHFNLTPEEIKYINEI